MNRGKEILVTESAIVEELVPNPNPNTEIRREDVTDEGSHSKAGPDDSVMSKNIATNSFTIQSTPQVSQAKATWIEDEAHNSPTKGSDPIVSNPLSGPIRDLREEKSNNKSIESISLSYSPAFAFGPNFKTCQVLRGKKGSRTTRIRDLGISTECSKILCGKRKVDPKEKEKSYGRRKARKVVGVYKIEGDISKKNSEGNYGEEVTKIMVSPTEFEDLESTLSAGRSSLARCSQ
ncbi:hypothetical protein LWI28_001210 [Acer negundo]|uniref:Uncharacterized protein n=1 Tax=Acer negundo TaxID=4023 RepID=A0AAD5NJE6_ACENE|nr:hypothetical protein LWI28_001210 [Acer negundo]